MLCCQSLATTLQLQAEAILPLPNNHSNTITNNNNTTCNNHNINKTNNSNIKCLKIDVTQCNNFNKPNLWLHSKSKPNSKLSMRITSKKFLWLVRIWLMLKLVFISTTRFSMKRLRTLKDVLETSMVQAMHFKLRTCKCLNNFRIRKMPKKLLVIMLIQLLGLKMLWVINWSTYNLK